METTMIPDDAASVPLTDQQQAFIKRFSFGAFSLGLFYYFGSRLNKQGWLMFIPFYNIYLWFKGMFRGREMAWQNGKWPDFSSYQSRQKLLDRTGIVFIIASVAFITIVFVNVFKAIAPATNAANAFMNDLESGQVQAAYSLTTSDFQNQTSLQVFDQTYVTSSWSNIKSYYFSTRNVYYGPVETATMVGSATLKNGTSVPIEIDLLNQKNIWLVQYIGLESQANVP